MNIETLEEKQIINNCVDCPTIPYAELKTYQFNDLKEQDSDSLCKLENSIVNNGINAPFYIWHNKRYVIDGKQRQTVLQILEDKGFKLPDLPYISIKAPSLQVAQEIVLQVSSQYGKITQKSFENFVKTLDISKLKQTINIPTVKLDIVIPKLDKLNIPNLESKAEESIEEEHIEIEKDRELITKFGDIWELNNHRIICGDSREKDTYQALMLNDKAQMVFTDPPYNLSNAQFAKRAAEKHKDFATASGELKSSQFTEYLKDIFKNLISVSIDGSIHYVCMDWRHMNEIITAGLARYTEFKNLCIWAKDQAGNGSFYKSQHELVFVFKNGKAKHINNFELGQYGRNRSNVWKYPSSVSFGNADREREGNKTIGISELANHPTPKPVKMVEDACLDCSEIDGIILDCFLGSGTTLIACENTQRICRGIEIEPIYIDSTIRRWIKLMQKNDKEFTIKCNGKDIDYSIFA